MPPVTSLRRARILLVALVVGLTAWSVASAAVAHDVLISSSPQDGEVLDESPPAVVLTFNNPPLEVGSAVVIEDTDGVQVVAAEGVVEGADVRVDLTEALAGGEYTVVWRVASSDGHPIEGRIAFTVATSQTTTSQPAPGPTTVTTSEAATSETATAIADPPPAPTTDAPALDGSGGLPTWVTVVVAIVAVGTVGTLVVIAVRRQRAAE